MVFTGPNVQGTGCCVNETAPVSTHITRARPSALNVLRGYLREGIRPDELADQKSAATGSAKVALATNRGLAASMLGMEFNELGLDHVDLYPERINAVTVEEVNAAIRKHFNPDALTIVMAGDLSDAKTV